MKILLHTCCAPCSIYPVSVLENLNMEVMVFFYRHNIHPFQECMKREQTLKEYAAQINMNVIYQKDYQLENFLQSMAFREQDRCRICYHTRLNATALIAKKGKFDLFSTTLLYSKFQNHELIRETGEAIGKKHSVRFFYNDFRKGWRKGIQESKALNMYRQQYCGCIYSERDRFFREAKEQ